MSVEHGDPSEIGRELSVAELRPGMIVVVDPGRRDRIVVSVWVTRVTEHFVVFSSGVANAAVVQGIRDGKLYDDRDRQIRVYQYLGPDQPKAVLQ